ncbi:MAG: hypothetical protein AB7E52_01830 [Bdellovibrionales bacterium]
MNMGFLWNWMPFGQAEREIVEVPQAEASKYWGLLAYQYPQVYDALKVVYKANPRLVRSVQRTPERALLFKLSMPPSDGKDAPVYVAMRGKKLQGHPHSIVEVTSPSKAVESVLTQAEFRGHIEFGPNGLNVNDLTGIRPGHRARGVLPKCSVFEMQKLCAG